MKIHMGVSLNGGTPKSSILIGFSIINHPFWGTPIFGNTHMVTGRFLKSRRYPLGNYTLGLINGWNLQITRAPIQEHLPGKLGKLLFRISWDISVDRPKVDLKSSSSLDQKVVSWCPFLDEWKISKYNFWPLKKTSPLKNPRQNVCT